MQSFRICHIANFRIFKIKFFWICQIANFRKFSNWIFSNLPNCKFLEFPQLKIFRILEPKLLQLSQLENEEISRFFHLEKSKFGSKNWQFWNCSSPRHSALFAILSILIFALWYKSITTLWLLSFYFIF